MHEPAPQALFDRIRAGDRRALSEFYESEVDALYAFVFYRVGRDSALAEDVVQETFCRALDALDAYDTDRGSTQNWLRTLSRNAIRAALRHRTRGEELIAVWEQLDDALMAAFEALDSVPLSDAILEREETRELVHMTITQLPDTYRSALERKYIGGDSLDELASSLGVSYDAAKSLLARARRAFRAAFVALHRQMAEVQS